jgi:hypothetical protein
LCLRVKEDMTKGKQVDQLIHGKMIGRHLPLFPCKSGTETIVMTEKMETAGTVGHSDMRQGLK